MGQRNRAPLCLPVSYTYCPGKEIVKVTPVCLLWHVFVACTDLMTLCNELTVQVKCTELCIFSVDSEHDMLQGDYVPSSDADLARQYPEYDVILALSVTKWIHLTHGDAGLKRAFVRMFLQLRAGGKLVLEAQPWASYKRKKKLTVCLHVDYSSLKHLVCVIVSCSISLSPKESISTQTLGLDPITFEVCWIQPISGSNQVLSR